MCLCLCLSLSVSVSVSVPCLCLCPRFCPCPCLRLCLCLCLCLCLMSVSMSVSVPIFVSALASGLHAFYAYVSVCLYVSLGVSLFWVSTTFLPGFLCLCVLSLFTCFLSLCVCMCLYVSPCVSCFLFVQDATQGHACCFEYSFTRIPQVSQVFRLDFGFRAQSLVTCAAADTLSPNTSRKCHRLRCLATSTIGIYL